MGDSAPMVKDAEKTAKKAAKALAQGSNLKKTVKIHYKTKFHRPKTLRLLRNPKYSKRSVPKVNPLDQYSILKYPLTTESAMKKIEDNNTWFSSLTRALTSARSPTLCAACTRSRPPRSIRWF